MPPSLRTRPHRPSSGERVFADDSSRLWSAAFTQHGTGWALVFACITDARQPIRVLALREDELAVELTEAVLQGWLTNAPRLEALP